ncbi:MAG: hypothetical protein LQ342_006401 [Letrouitia transgressa]|nr:MAG: hypothetical protein LQ342_006401 [Letrouitia transgressa]
MAEASKRPKARAKVTSVNLEPSSFALSALLMPNDPTVVYGSLIKDDSPVPEVRFHLHRLKSDKFLDWFHQGWHYLSEVHNIFYKFFKGIDVNAKLVDRNDDERLANLSDVNEQEFLRLEFAYKPGDIEVVRYDSYSGSNVLLQELYNKLESIPKSGTLNLYIPVFDQREKILEKFLDNQFDQVDILEPFYHTSKTGKPVPRVQFGQIRAPPQGMTALGQRITYHNYGEYNLIYGNGEYLEYQHEVSLIKKLRETPVKMVTIPAYGKDAFFGFLTIPNFPNYRSILHPRNSLAVFNQGPPEANEVGEGLEDNAEGYSAKIVSSDFLESNCNIVVFFVRPKNQSNSKHHQDTGIERMVLGDHLEGQSLPSQTVWLKVSVSSAQVKTRLDALRLHSYVATKGDDAFKQNRAFLCARDLTVHKTVDLFHGLENHVLLQQFQSMEGNPARLQALTSSQHDAILLYLRHLQHGFGIILGPVGTGKTYVTYAMAFLRSLVGEKTLIVTSTNAAASNAAQRCAKDGLLKVMRLLPYSVEQGEIDIASKNEARRMGVKRIAADPGSDDSYEDECSDEESQPPASQYNVKQSATMPGSFNDLDEYSDEELKVPASHSSGPSPWLSRLIVHETNDPELAEKAQRFKILLDKSVSQFLNSAEKKEFSKLFQEFVEWCMGQMDVVVSTTQTAARQVNHNLFSAIINDEATTTREAELLSVWRDPSQVVVLVGDQEQLQPTIMSSKHNPFAPCISLSPLERFVRAGLPFIELRESQRMVSGLMDMTNELFYSNRLRSGPGTSIEHRPLAAAVRQAVNRHFEGLKEEPTGMVYPCLLDVKGTCRKEEQGSSRFNLDNIGVVLQTIHWLLDTIPDLKADQIGIVAPYTAQVVQYRQAIQRFHKDQPNVDILDVSVQISEQIQGGQKEIIFADFVRAQNDEGSFGFLAKHARLNVLTSRQMSALFIVFDCKAVENQGFEEFRQAADAEQAWNDTYRVASNRVKQRMRADEANKTRRERYVSLRNAYANGFATFQKMNKHLLRIVRWCQERGRVSPAGNDLDDEETSSTEPSWDAPAQEDNDGQVRSWMTGDNPVDDDIEKWLCSVFPLQEDEAAR